MEPQTFFAPQLFLSNVADGIFFYEKAFGATVIRQWTNDDGSIHVAELQIGDALFHLHEEVQKKGELSPATLTGTSVIIGLFTKDPDALYNSAVAAGATILSPLQDHDYNYRQGTVADPFGHHWMIEKRIGS